jgi:hypothetical protein
MESKRSHKTLVIIVLGVLAAMVIAVVASFFGARAYYAHRAAPGISFAGENISGKTVDDVQEIVSSKSTESAILITDSNGAKVKAKLTDLGVKTDEKRTVDNILKAKSENEFVKLNPFRHESVPMTVTMDKTEMSDYLTKSLVDESKRAQPSSVGYDEASSKFLVYEGKRGSVPRIESVVNAVEAVVQQPGQTVPAKVSYRDVDMPIKADVATRIADDANKRLETPMIVDNSKGVRFTVPRRQVAQWIKPVSDIRSGSIAISYDDKAVKEYAAKELSTNLNQDMVVEKTVKNSKGDLIVVITKGRDGVKIKNVDAIATQMVEQLTAGNIAPITAAVDVEPHKEEVRTVRADVPDGDMWVEVNLSTQTATAYKGTTLVKSFPICSGLTRDGNESDLGTFFINVRYQIQTMRGPGYVSPDVRWVSYYNGSEGFHTALWNYDGIAHGDAANRGSHGCINMYEQDAKWIYDNCPVGTMIKVVGAQPTHPVR